LTYICAADGPNITFHAIHAIIFESSLSLKVLEQKPATQGHSRPFIMQSITGQQRVVYRHTKILALSLKFPKK